MDPTQEVAAFVFSAVTIQVGITLVVLRPSCRELWKILYTIDPHQRLSAIFKFGNKEDYLQLISFFLALGIVFFIITIALGLIALNGVVATMLGFNWGPYQQSNFDWSRYFTIICTLTFVLGFYFIGNAYLIKGLKFMPRKKRDKKKVNNSRESG